MDLGADLAPVTDSAQSLVREGGDESEGLMMLTDMLEDEGEFEDLPSEDEGTMPVPPDSSFEVSLGVDVSACVDVAYSMLPVEVPKPIFEQGVWKDILGHGHFMKDVFQAKLICRPVQTFFGQESTSSSVLPTTVKKPRLQYERDGPNFSRVVSNTSTLTWQEERESLLQSSLKRWLVTLECCSPFCAIRMKLDSSDTELAKLQILADVFSGRAPATLLKRVRAVEKMCRYFGDGEFPTGEGQIYFFLCNQREAGAPASRLRSFLEAISFCAHVLDMDALLETEKSKRCIGTTNRVPGCVILQSSPLMVVELLRLHDVLDSDDQWDRLFAGTVLFAVYARARWADLMHVGKLVVDRDEWGFVHFLEGQTYVHKTMSAEIFRHRFLPLTAPSLGVAEKNWVDGWLDARAQLGLGSPPDFPIMPAPNGEGCATSRSLSSAEASKWLRILLFGKLDQPEGRKVSIQSCKATCLSYCAKFGLDELVRLQLGYHTAGFKMLHTYSRDAAARPLAELSRVLSSIRDKTFAPDSTRSGRFSEKVVNSTTRSKPPSGGEVVVLDEVKPESSDEGFASSSSGDTSFEEFQEEMRVVKELKPPVPPEGYVFWQHKKLKTLHLSLPHYSRILMCSREIGPQHVKGGVSIRYDTPVCRVCMSSVRAQAD